MNQPALRVVEDREDVPVIKPKFLGELENRNTKLREIFVYSQRDFYMGCSVQERSRSHDPNNKVIPYFGDRNLVDLGGEFTVEQVMQALKKQERDEVPEITQLRARIVQEIEDRKLFYTAVRTPEEANEKGVVFLEELDAPEIPLGVMAYEH